MARLAPLKRDDMNDEQRAAYDKVAARGGRLGGPSGIFVRVPELFELNQELGDYLRAGHVSARLRQLAILVIVRHYNAKYPWGVQARASLNEGISRDIVDAINARQKPALTDPDDQTVYDVTVEMVARGTLSDESFAQAEKQLGFHRLLDLVAIIGFYTAVGLVANVYQIDEPKDVPILLAP
jgi:4-carboxymuconolactone decarboxylase